jgi:hypothetical protein
LLLQLIIPPPASLPPSLPPSIRLLPAVLSLQKARNHEQQPTATTTEEAPSGARRRPRNNKP